ncbi:hypothetical protein ACPOL_6176 [Acidisarcina polymorpha]|uniref:Uncharacterized protein n=1 Tax=Acidisarcina polymorpha TaxID=2211140 RepID=A0A2Z5G8X6_9BACT|nr:hypothetical protein [Acidisarcina polymorpha]AXC15420.1 hypothetical protein ACPOL_6176 [Acidisarcina polymorpha]
MKTRNDFRTQEEWLAFVHETVAAEDIPFTLAIGLTRMYQQFYEVRSQPFPERLFSEIERISAMAEPGRTQELEALNNTIMGDIIQFLFTASSGRSTGGDCPYPVTPREIIEQLLEHLRTKNPYFALWTHYKDNVSGRESAPEWREYVIRTMGVGEDREIEFAHLMSELGRCLDLYRQREMPLPKHFYFQIWFLYRTNGPERNAMTRALVQELVEGLEPCASA